MPFSNPRRRFQDIIDNIGWIHDDVADLEWTAFENSRTIYDAVLYRLLRISEAAKKIGDIADEFAPDQPWQQIQSFGNILRHDYDTIDLVEIWRIIEKDLPSLLSACEQAVSKIEQS